MRAAVLVAVLAVAATAPAWPAKPVSHQQTETQKKLDAVRAKIARLTDDQHRATVERDRLSQALMNQAQALGKAAAELSQSEQRLEQLQQKLDALNREQTAIQARLDTQHEALAELLRATYKLGHGSDLRMLLGHVRRCPADDNGASCAAGEAALARVQRALAYSRYFQADRAHKIRQLLDELAKHKRLEQQISAQKLDIENERDTRRGKRDALVAERDRQKQLLARAEAQITQRGKNIQQLEQDRKSLEKLLDELRDVFADIPSKLPEDTPFSKRRGQLPWPVDGAPRAQKDGILIAAKVGSKVRAVAHGRVAYADWLRGYGMLVIIDHGDGWMSLYGGNESLLRSVGDWVNAGDVLATSGRSETSVAGLYFGLRHKSKAVNPRRWLRPR